MVSGDFLKAVRCLGNVTIDGPFGTFKPRHGTLHLACHQVFHHCKTGVIMVVFIQAILAGEFLPMENPAQRKTPHLFCSLPRCGFTGLVLREQLPVSEQPEDVDVHDFPCRGRKSHCLTDGR